MAERDHILLGVGFYPDWFYQHYGISFDEKYYFEPETRIEARMEMEKRLFDRFGDVGLGKPKPKPTPLITFGMVMLPAVFGCDMVFEKDALPWAIPLNLSEDEIMKLQTPDLLNTYPMTEVIKQIEYLKEKYGKVLGDINTTGVQNLAMKIRGDQLYIDYFENPKLCHHLIKICAESIIQLFRLVYKITGTGAVDVTPMADPRTYVIPNCTVEQISRDTYEKFLMDYDNLIADACHPLGIHHCGSIDEVLEGYAQVRHLEFLEIGFGSDVKRTRNLLGPKVAVNARINPVLMKNGIPEEVEAEVRALIDQGSPLHNFSIDTVGLTYGTPDENVKRARRTAAEYGKIHADAPIPVGKRPIYSLRTGTAALETNLSRSDKTVLIGAQHPLVIIGERINPTGRSDLVRALENRNLDLLQAEAKKQVEAGAQIVDVNVGVSGIDEPSMLKEAIDAIREVTDAPICIDSALPKALEAALEAYDGKALINSVNGEEQKLAQILPMVKAHGAAVIGLTMDDRGIPKNAEDRLKMAERIVERAEKEGIPRQDVIIDPLAMAVSSDHQAGYETLKALELIRNRLGVNQTLGLSNISFGLPDRAAINAAFLAVAASKGLTCAIADPTVWEIRRAVLLANLFLGKDEFCRNYLSITARKRPMDEKPSYDGLSALPDPFQIETIHDAVIEGKRELALGLTRKALKEGIEPQELIDRHLIPALDVVGERFEKNIIFIPEMMISARTMQACLDLVKPLLKKEAREAAPGTVVIGTVFGDLHDIGKNLVKLLLESAGLNVIDLGENVPAEQFVEAARTHHADIVGLSSLLTTGDPFVRKTIKALKESDMARKVKVVCGGAALTRKFVEETCGAHAYAKDAADGLKKIKKLLSIST